MLFMNLSTHRITQPSSLECSDFVVKSLTQSSKHRWTRLEYVYHVCQTEKHVTWVRLDRGNRPSNIHEFFHLLLFHSRLELSLLLRIETVWSTRSARFAMRPIMKHIRNANIRSVHVQYLARTASHVAIISLPLVVFQELIKAYGYF